MGTTFSLDLHALLTAPLSFALLDAGSDTDGGASPTAILESVRRNADRLDIFCQAGQIALPAEYRPLTAYLEEVVHEVAPPTEGRVFHPKVWVIRFADGERRSYRLLCLSRNLTFDRSWDTALKLDGWQARRTARLRNRNRPLTQFVAALPGLAIRPIEQGRASAVRELAEDLLAVEFELPQGLSDLRFWPLGLSKRAHWPFAERAWRHSRMLVVSPFLSPGLLRSLPAPGVNDVLISRSETLDALPESDYEQFEQRFVMAAAAPENDAAAEPDLGADDEELAERAESDLPLRGLHAKLYVSEYWHSARLWTGSANATSAAFHGNVEFLVQMQGPRSLCGIDAILSGSGDGPHFVDLLETYEPPDEVTSETAETRLERRLDEARRALATCGFVAIVEPEGDSRQEDEQYSLTVRAADAGAKEALRGITARAWPIALGATSQRPLGPAFAKGLRFAPVSFGALTAFVAVELEARTRAARASARFVVSADLIGAPEDRVDRLLASILRDRGEVLRYLILLLADEGAAVGIETQLVGDGAGSTWLQSDGLPLFESLVRALARDPERLDHVARLVESLKASAEGRKLLPDGLDAIWDPVWEARKRVRR